MRNLLRTYIKFTDCMSHLNLVACISTCATRKTFVKLALLNMVFTLGV